MNDSCTYIIVTKDRPDHLKNAIDNALELKQANDELIVIDGGDATKTAKIIADCQDNIDHYLAESDNSEGHGANKGLLLAQGEYIKFVTDDDYIYPCGMQAALATLRADETIDAIIAKGELARIDSQSGEIIDISARCLKEDDPLTAENLPLVWCGLGLVIRRTVLAKCGLLDPTFLLTDANYIARIWLSGCKMTYLDDVLYRHNWFVDKQHSVQQVQPDRVLQDHLRLDQLFGWPEKISTIHLPTYVAMHEAKRSRHKNKGLSANAHCQIRWLEHRFPRVLLALLTIIGLARKTKWAVSRLKIKWTS